MAYSYTKAAAKKYPLRICTFQENLCLIDLLIGAYSRNLETALAFVRDCDLETDALAMIDVLDQILKMGVDIKKMILKALIAARAASDFHVEEINNYLLSVEASFEPVIEVRSQVRSFLYGAGI